MLQHPHVSGALKILIALGLPRAQQNERSALTLLALLNLGVEKSWQQGESPLIGITPIMDFIRENYGKHYAPNTRETIRRQTMHQFVAAGIALYNPDDPARPVNSPKAVYQIEPTALALLHVFDTNLWDTELAKFIAEKGTLQERYSRQRQQRQLSVSITPNAEIRLSPGGHSKRIKQIIQEELAALFTCTSAGLIYITAFPSRKIMNRYLSMIAWETEVWVAENPSHLIHFDGTRFLGPYPR